MEELFSSIISKVENRDSSLLDEVNQLKSELLDEDLDQLFEIKDEIDRKATILWNKVVSVTRDIKAEENGEETQFDSEFLEKILPQIRCFCVKLYEKFAEDNKEKIFRSSATTSQILFETRDFEDSLAFFEIAFSTIQDIDLSEPSNAQCLVQLFITKSKCLIAYQYDTENALQCLKELTSSFNVMSSSLTNYIIRTAENLRSLDWTSFAMDMVKQMPLLGEQWTVSSASIHIQALIENNSIEEALAIPNELQNISEESKNYLNIRALIQSHRMTPESFKEYSDTILSFSTKYLAQICTLLSENCIEIGKEIVPILKKAVKKSPNLSDSALNVAIQLDDFLLASSLQNMTETGLIQSWNYAIELKSQRKYTDAAQWASLVISHVSKEKEAKILRFQSKCFCELGEYDHAEALAKEAISLNQNSTESFQCLIEVLIKAGKIHEIAEFCLAQTQNIDIDSLLMCCSLLINATYIKDSLDLILSFIEKKCISNPHHTVNLTNDFMRIIAACLQRLDNDELIKNTLLFLAQMNSGFNSDQKEEKHLNLQINFEEIDSSVRRALCVTCYNTCRKNGPLSVLILGLEASEATDSSEALSICSSNIAFRQENDKALNRILDLSIEKAPFIAETIRVQLALIKGENGVQEIQALTTKEALISSAKSVCYFSHFVKKETILSLMEKAKELDCDEDTSTALVSALIHTSGIITSTGSTAGIKEMKERFENALSFIESIPISQPGIEGLVAFAWNTGRELIGSNEAEWWLSQAISLCSKHKELESLYKIISSQYDSFIETLTSF